MTTLALLGSMYMMKVNDGDSQICVGTAQSLRAPFPPVSEKLTIDLSQGRISMVFLQCGQFSRDPRVCAFGVNSSRVFSGHDRRSEKAHLCESC